ncbi:MAG: Rrf2 family transcriptional regulator [Syntrophomonadaceae bacterium]|jgi:Rrf2 family protein|nr:Rrf2 family transcriptional regulator [Syntrophomonadaceae bacterium]
MQINQATDYSFRVVLYLSTQPRGAVVDANTIAQTQCIPMRYLFKIMPTLTRAGIITSQRGVGGGYILAKDPAEISLLDVIEAIEGPIRLNRCLIDEQFCSKHGPPDCPVHNALAGIQRRLTAEFDKVRFSDLLG